MNRYFFRLPHNGEHYYKPTILVLSPSLEYYWERRGEPPPNGFYHGHLTPNDAQAPIHSELYLELRSESDREMILNRLSVGEHTEANWREALAPYALTSTPLPKRPDPRLKTNHKLGAPKGELP